MRELWAMVVALVCLTNALPTSSEDGIPRPALRASMLKESSNSLLPPSIAQVQSMQVLVSAKQNTVDSDGDTHVSTESTRIPRGKLGSTDHLKDDQFFLNIPFTDVEFDVDVEVTWVRPAAQMSKLDYIGLYFQNDTDDAIPCNWEFAPGDGPTGTVKLRMSNHGDLEIRYFDVAADRPRIRLPIHVHSPCPNNCTNRGICEKGVCVCFPPYKGEECCEVGGKIAIATNVSTVTVGKAIHVTLTPPAGSLDKRNWIGVFANNASSQLNITSLI